MNPDESLISYVCNHCERHLESEVKMLIHLKWAHNRQLPPEIDEALFSPNVEEKIRELKRNLV